MNLKKMLFLVAALFALGEAASAQTVIQPGQAIKIALRGVSADEAARVSGEYPVSSNGTINLPLIGTIGAAGQSPTSLATRIESAYKSAQIYDNPTIAVFASSAETLSTQVVHVGGRVKRTGTVEFVPGLTIYQAIQIAGGPDEFGDMKKVRLTRDGKVRELNLKKDQFKRFVLQQKDTIEVPEKGILPW